MSILVTAANGKVGTSLTHELSRRGHHVRAAVHDPVRAKGRFPENVEVVELDFADAGKLATALKGIDTVALITPPSPQQVDYATLAIDTAKQEGVRRVVRLSVLAAAMEPGIQLGRWHRAVERYLQGSGLDWTILRPGPFFQNLAGMYTSRDGLFELPAGDAAVNHIDVADVALAIAEAIEDESSSGKIHMVTGPEALTFAQIAEQLSAGTGRSYRYTALDAGAARGHFAEMMSPPMAAVVAELFAAFRTGAVGMRTSTFRELVGREPRGIEAFAKSMAPSGSRTAPRW